jgi:hypothetical protein
MSKNRGLAAHSKNRAGSVAKGGSPAMDVGCMQSFALDQSAVLTIAAHEFA